MGKGGIRKRGWEKEREEGAKKDLRKSIEVYFHVSTNINKYAKV